ncbi:MAG: biotin--[acetyl-CoA-carboxylase] ligase [Planctomycetota bacterium]|nr:biotin--[acetyl-CoA-carboxylase] ligase [Planctomycetota bacterium]
MSESVPIEHWPKRLEAALEQCDTFQRVHVIRETDSTQDAARRLNVLPGDVVVAWSQTGGRGRRGRSWSSGEEGAAITFAIEPGQSERLALIGAVAAARAAEEHLGVQVAIKWPNDIYAQDLKLAGVLVEQSDAISLPAIGMNVLQTTWPPELTDKAISLRQLGAEVDRVDVLASLIVGMDHAIQTDEQELIEFFKARDCLKGVTRLFRSEDRDIKGRILCIEPLEGILIETEAGEVWLPATKSRLLDSSDIL